MFNFDINFNPMAFVDNLKYMGQGMLGIFVVIGIIIVFTMILAKVSSKIGKKNDEE